MKSTLIITSILVLALQSDALNILGIFPYHGKSHFFVFKVLLRELANKGHNVTVISHFPEKNPIANFNDISLAGSIKVYEDDIPLESSYIIMLGIFINILKTGIENCKVMLANKQVQEMIHQKPKFDVILVEQFNSDCALGVAYKLGAPVVGIATHVLMPFHYQRLGVPYNPSYVPFHFLGGGTKPTLFQRMERAFFDFLFRNLFYWVTQRSDHNTLLQYFDDIPPLQNLAREIKFILVYQNFVLTGSRLFPSNVIEVGGFHVEKSKPLTGDLKTFIEESEHGVIYICFGSVIRASTMSSDKVAAVLAVMKELPYRFVWKWENDTILNDKNKLYISKWLPQVDILGHPKVKVFFSHSGMLGTSEALHYGVPVVSMPIMGDQPANAAAIEESGLGVQIQINDLNKDSLLKAFKTVLKPEFRENVKVLSKAWRDRPKSALDTAVFWTEFTAKYPNMTLRTRAADIPIYQYLYLDIAFVTVTIILFTIITMKLTMRISFKKSKLLQEKKSKRA